MVKRNLAHAPFKVVQGNFQQLRKRSDKIDKISYYKVTFASWVTINGYIRCLLTIDVGCENAELKRMTLPLVNRLFRPLSNDYGPIRFDMLWLDPI